MDARKINNQIFVQNLKSFRGINRLTQSKLAKLLGIRLYHICRWEEGDIKNISSYKESIERIFKCSITDLLDKDLRHIWRVDENIIPESPMLQDMKLTYNGLTYTIPQWASATGIDKFTIYARVRKGWDIKKILTKGHVRLHAKQLTYNNITLTVSEWAAALGINKATLHLRLRKGVPLDQAFQTGYIRYPK